MKFGLAMEVHHSGLYVTERHEKWLQANPNPIYSPEAIRLAETTFSEAQRDRTKSFSASHLSGCPRAAQFQYRGLPQREFNDAHLINIFHNGDFMHLRWQMAGMTAGWLDMAEVFRGSEQWWLKGSLDGILDNGWGLELKSIHSNGFKQVLQYGGKKEHLTQIDAYFLLWPEIGTFSLIYENKDTQDYKEIVVEREEKRVEELEDRLLKMIENTRSHIYFDIRDDCWKGEGQMFRHCPYSEICRDQGVVW